MTSIVKGLFGGRSSAEKILQRFRPVGFSAPGLRGTFADNRFTLTRTPAAGRSLADIRSGFAGRADVLRDRASALLGQRDTLTGLRGEVSGLRPGLARLRGDVRSLREEVRPGFGRLTRSRLAGLRDIRERTIGDLREELSKRRVAGSSFATSQVAGAEAEFAREEDRIRAESFLQEMDATNQLIQQELGITAQEGDLLGEETSIALQEAGLTDLSFQSLAAAFDSSIAAATAELEQLNMETGLAAALSQTASQLMNANLTAQAQARASQEVGAMNFLSDVIGAFIAET